MIKEIKYGGYSASPDDYISPDGEMAAAIGLVPENNGLHPVLPPTPLFRLEKGERLLWIHNVTGYTHYITIIGGLLYWTRQQQGQLWDRKPIDGGAVTGLPTVASIGNTLVVNDDSGVNYFLWSTDRADDPGYIALGQRPPMLEISFGLHADFAVWPDKKNSSSDVSDYGGADIRIGNIKETIVPKLGDRESDNGAAWAEPRPVMAVKEMDNPNKQQRFRDFAVRSATYSVEQMYGETDEEKDGLATFKNVLSQGVFARINAFTNERGTRQNRFVLPFFIRYAYRLYDDSFIMHSYPVLMIPNSRGPVFALDGLHGLALNDNNDNMVGVRFCGRAYGFLAKLVYSIASVPERLKLWKDVVTSVDIGVSAPAYTFDQAGTVFGWTNMDGNNAWDEYYSICRVTQLAGQDESGPTSFWQPGGIYAFKKAFEALENKGYHSTQNYGDFFNRYDNNYRLPSYIATVPQRDISDINNTLTGPTSFYIIKQFELDELNICSEKELEMDKGTLSGLLGRSRIDDDYRSHDHLAASLLYNYNGRMNYAGVKRSPHAPLSPLVQFPLAAMPGVGETWSVAVTVNSDTQQITVQGDEASSGLEFPRWVFYPDVNAKAAYITRGTTTYRLKLTPHDHLNGAYWLGNIMQQQLLNSAHAADAEPDVSNGAFDEADKLYTSNVYNPWAFNPSNVKTVGTGRIIGLCSAAKAMSQGQFGLFPLYVFTDQGVCALEVSDSGAFKPSQPFTRDVCLGADSITQLDSAVLFATERGIMLIQGSASLCISDAIFTRTPFRVDSLPQGDRLIETAGFDRECFDMAPLPDFISECRMLYDYVHQRVIVYSPSAAYAYVYSLESKQWGMMRSAIVDNPNAYPRALAVLRTTDGDTVADFSTPDVSKPMPFLAVTRPLKLGSGDIFKTVSTVIQRGYMGKDSVSQALFASNDLRHWVPVFSSSDIFLRGSSGTPYKWFRIALLGSLSDGESITGCSIDFGTRYTNRLR